MENYIKKIFILDTNVLLHDANAMYQFENNLVVIPIIVLEELDKFKKRMDEIGRNCRIVSRYLDELRNKGGHLHKGVDLPNGGKLQIIMRGDELNYLPQEFRNNNPDNCILAIAKLLKETTKQEIVLVSKDVNMRIKADTLDVKAEDYEVGKVNIEELYPGVTKYYLSETNFKILREQKKLTLKDDNLFFNQCVIVAQEGFEIDESDKNELFNNCIFCLYDKKENLLRELKYTNKQIWGIKPKNIEQKFAFELLLNDDIKLVTLLGFAGTGKTLLALAMGLHKVLDETKYTKLLVSRPIIPLGKDIGFLPGDVYEKLMPRMQPISDNLEFLFKESNTGRIVNNEMENLIENGIIELEAVTYIRGRSIPEQFIIVDEAQNLTQHEIKTIITRVGNNTKIVFTGDPYQIDHPYLDSNSNGLTYLVERFKNQAIAGHITFRKGERSELAELAAELL